MQFPWVTAVGQDILIPSEKPIIAECLCAESPGENETQRERERERGIQSDRGVHVKLSETPPEEAVSDMIIDL